MNILSFIKNKGKKSVISTFVGITDESLKANIILYEEQLKKSIELKNFKSFLEEEGIFDFFSNQQVFNLYENQIISAENVLKDIINDLHIVYKKDVNDKERINKIASFENLLNYYRNNLFFYENFLKTELNNKLKEQEKYSVYDKKITAKILNILTKKSKQK